MTADVENPCPFCGSFRLYLQEIARDRGTKYVRCESCDALGPQALTAEKACELWDYREQDSTDRESGEAERNAARILESGGGC